jgi:group II intron reverse transcriptase/maturase
MRPLGIPTMKDRAQQALYLLALAPVVETTADKNSYGFRQQRSCADAMEQCFKALRSANTQWILEGDIKSCFDKISHDWLLAHVPMDRVILQKWLKSGYMEKHVLHDTTDGTPQGGIISPALANCALDGLERLLQEKYPTGKRLKSLGGEKPCVNFVRYADDFVITSKSKELLEGEIKPLVEQFLQERGLELSPTKTVITHVEHGFDFLGQNVRRYPNGKLFIKPSKKNVGTFLKGIRRIIKDAHGVSAADLIDTLNPKIRGWANYHRHVVSKHTFDTWIATSSLVCGNGHDEGTPTKARAGSNPNILTGAGIVTGPSSVKPAMTKDSQINFGFSTPRALPSNDMSRLKAKLTRVIQPMKPTSKNAKGLTCWKRFGVPALFAISGMNNVDSAPSAIQRSPGSQAGAFITASPV